MNDFWDTLTGHIERPSVDGVNRGSFEAYKARVAGQVRDAISTNPAYWVTLIAERSRYQPAGGDPVTRAVNYVTDNFCDAFKTLSWEE